jgi:hypothetical protein
MIFVVSGEGPSDIGVCVTGQGECSGGDFKPGPMAEIIDRLVESATGFPLPDGAMEFVSEARRLDISKNTLPKSFYLGKKRDYEEGYYFKEARALAHIAKQKAHDGNCPASAVLFRDADSNERADYETVWKSIDDGFKAEDFEWFGVPMVPKPTSEAWLICALKNPPYQHCADLEESLSGTGKGHRPAKATLEGLLDSRGKMIDDLAELVEDGTISPFQIDMPSFNRFRARLEEVTNRMLGRPPLPQQN